MRPFFLRTVRFFAASGMILFCLASWQACKPGGDKGELVLRLKEVVLRENPARPPSELPGVFFYQGAKILKTGIYRTERRIAAPEGVVVFSTPDDPATVTGYFTRVVRKREWKIIQSLRNPEEHLLMVESSGRRYKRLITIILRGRGPTTIKIYFRRSEID